MATIYLGVDMAKATFVAARWQGEAGEDWGTFPNTAAGFAQLAEQVQQASGASPADPIHLTLEPTGG